MPSRAKKIGPDQLVLTRAIAERVQSAEASDDIGPYADEIIIMVERLLLLDSRRIDFVGVLRRQARVYSLVAYMNGEVEDPRDSSWGRLAARLDQFVSKPSKLEPVLQRLRLVRYDLAAWL